MSERTAENLWLVVIVIASIGLIYEFGQVVLRILAAFNYGEYVK